MMSCPAVASPGAESGVRIPILVGAPLAGLAAAPAAAGEAAGDAAGDAAGEAAGEAAGLGGSAGLAGAVVGAGACPAQAIRKIKAALSSPNRNRGPTDLRMVAS